MKYVKSLKAYIHKCVFTTTDYDTMEDLVRMIEPDATTYESRYILEITADDLTSNEDLITILPNYLDISAQTLKGLKANKFDVLIICAG